MLNLCGKHQKPLINSLRHYINKFLCPLTHHNQFTHSKYMNQYETYQTEKSAHVFKTKPKPYLIKTHSANPTFIHKSLNHY